MRKIIVLSALAGILLNLCVFSLLAQEKAEKPKSQLFIIHEDVVKPSMIAKYEKAARGFKRR